MTALLLRLTSPDQKWDPEKTPNNSEADGQTGDRTHRAN